MESLSLDTDTELYNIAGTDYIVMAGIFYDNRSLHSIFWIANIFINRLCYIPYICKKF